MQSGNVGARAGEEAKNIEAKNKPLFRIIIFCFISGILAVNNKRDKCSQTELQLGISSHNSKCIKMVSKG